MLYPVTLYWIREYKYIKVHNQLEIMLLEFQTDSIIW